MIIKKKNLNQILLGRVNKKLKCKIVVDYWLEVYKEKGSVRIERYRECQLNSKGKENDCQFVVNQSEHVKAISGVFRKENCWHLTFPLSYYNGCFTVSIPIDRIFTEEALKTIEIRLLELEVIEKQGLGSRIVELLKDLVVKNMEEDRGDYIFYTDGSWYKEKAGLEDRMGSAWVQLDREEKLVVSFGKVRVVDWPSSTRPELVAILCSLLVTRSYARVTIKTDSSSAIRGIEKVLKSQSFKKLLKLKNRSTLDKIVEVIQAKGIVLDLIKVKAHSGLFWNERVDELAKEAAHLEEEWKWTPSSNT